MGAPPTWVPTPPPGPPPPPPPPEQPEAAQPRRRWWKRPFPLWAVVAVAVVGIGIGGAAGTTSAQKAEDDRDEAIAERDEMADALSDTEGERDDALDRIDDLEDDVAAAERRADEALEDATAEVEEANAGRVAEMDARQAALDQRESELAGREAAVAEAEGRIEANSFGDGVFQVGADIQPGRYHTDGREGCYWAMLGADGRDIIDNNISDGPQTIIIDSPFFESRRCGTWTLAP